MPLAPLLAELEQNSATWNCHNTTEAFRIYHEYEEDPARFQNWV